MAALIKGARNEAMLVTARATCRFIFFSMIVGMANKGSHFPGLKSHSISLY
jgi:hypothetical protein